VTIGGRGPVIEAGFAVAAAVFAPDVALRPSVLRAADAPPRAGVRRAAGADDAGFGILATLLAGVLRAAGVVFFVALVDCRVAIVQLISVSSTCATMK
jgi:hypothetical protein